MTVGARKCDLIEQIFSTDTDCVQYQQDGCFSLLEHGKQLYQESLSAFIRGSHEKPSEEKVFELMERGTHFIEEMNIRRIDFREFSPELQEAFRKLQQEGKLEIQD